MPDERRPERGAPRRLAADDVAERTFPTSFRGFDPAEVRGFLARLAEELRAAEHRETELQARLADAEERAAHPQMDRATLTGAVGEETARILQFAEEAAADIRARAEENVALLLREAHEEAARIRAEAETVLARESTEAERVAAEIRGEADADAAAALGKAGSEAERLIREVEERARQMVAEAESRRDRVLGDLARRRKVANAQVEQLRAGRERLLEAYRMVRTTLDEVTDELTRADGEARRAAERVGERLAVQGGPDGDDVADSWMELPASPPAGTPIVEEAEPAGDDTVVAAAGAPASAAPEVEVAGAVPAEVLAGSADLPPRGDSVAGASEGAGGTAGPGEARTGAGGPAAAASAEASAAVGAGDAGGGAGQSPARERARGKSGRTAGLRVLRRGSSGPAAEQEERELGLVPVQPPDPHERVRIIGAIPAGAAAGGPAPGPIGPGADSTGANWPDEEPATGQSASAGPLSPGADAVTAEADPDESEPTGGAASGVGAAVDASAALASAGSPSGGLPGVGAAPERVATGLTVGSIAAAGRAESGPDLEPPASDAAEPAESASVAPVDTEPGGRASSDDAAGGSSATEVNTDPNATEPGEVATPAVASAGWGEAGPDVPLSEAALAGSRSAAPSHDDRGSRAKRGGGGPAKGGKKRAAAASSAAGEAAESAESAEAAEAAEAGQPDVNELFARIRADRASAVAKARAVLSQDEPPEQVAGRSASPIVTEPATARTGAGPAGEEAIGGPEAPADEVVGAEEASALLAGPEALAGEMADPDDVTARPVPAGVQRSAGDEADGPAPVSDADESRLQRRDEVLVPIETKLVRRLKRALQDEQNDLMDRLRQRGAKPDVVLAGLDEHERYRRAGRDLLVDAALAGLAYAQGYGSGPAGAEVPLDDLVESLATDVGTPLRRRLLKAVHESAGEEQAVLMDLVSAAYRETKGQRVERVAADHAVAAFSRGTFLAVPEGFALRWLVDDDGGRCPDCDDNALAEAVPRGEPFPTGQPHPPAHAGCRCLLVPATP